MEPPTDVKERIRASYNIMANEYNAWTKRHDSFRSAYLDKLFEFAPELASPAIKNVILELGCGSGKPFLENLLLRAPAVYAHANDISDAQIELARANLVAYEDRVHLHAGDMTKLEFAPGSLAAVIGLYSIIHLPQQDQIQMLQNIGNWLRPGGTLVANFNLDETEGIVAEQWLHEDAWVFWSGLGKDRTVEAIKAAGLEVEKAVIEGDATESFLWVIAKKVAN
ncbi:S-adenosyl-L-methionine-dependent methyltransferase [Thelonectria olida]|uniref:S-adenosyl-L-methionine-dependent methyltransferase n=1 Tax=Thelonectria olida TaxID=1576542 RepID=A0A9P8VUC7_9HYPO|nr:S-adenosyl-L-methionine-dependent methyltransferase [Thelonectria olida]